MDRGNQWTKSSGILKYLTYSLDCANVTSVEFNLVWDFESATWWDTYEGYTRMSFGKLKGMVSGDVWIGNLL
ncbi:MAG: hypothetical protein WA977_00370, partial [Halobacteriota archaeon]